MAQPSRMIRIRHSMDARCYATLTIGQTLPNAQIARSRITVTPPMSNHRENLEPPASPLLPDFTNVDLPTRSGRPSARDWLVGSQRWKMNGQTKLMGIVNVTPDSFSDGGQFDSVSAAVEHALRLVEEGADILDIGGESTRPGATAVPLDEELRRVVPVVRELARQTKTPISIDTSKAEVARQCLEAGTAIVNDISGLTFDADMPRVCRESACGVIVMHIQGTPQTMQVEPRYDDVVADVCRHFSRRLNELEAAGISRERIVLDPGIGFGKTAEHNLDLLSHIATFHALGRPVLIGHSRKQFLKKVLGREVEERIAGTLGVSLALAAQGTDILRVHDVRATRDAILAWQTVLSASVLGLPTPSLPTIPEPPSIDLGPGGV